MNKFRAFFFLTILSPFILISCQTPAKKNSLSPEKQAELISKGKTIVGQSFKAFSKELMKSLQQGGVKNAVSYCHLQTSPLIDSLSKTYTVAISRVSDKYRNPDNKPGDLDITVLEAYQKQLAEGRELQAHLEMTADEVVFYSPILILNPACLQCHGEPGLTMEQENFDFIKSKYPEDLATGYKLGDLRGIWKIVF
jgi:hypothetical protein